MLFRLFAYLLPVMLVVAMLSGCEPKGAGERSGLLMDAPPGPPLPSAPPVVFQPPLAQDSQPTEEAGNAPAQTNVPMAATAESQTPRPQQPISQASTIAAQPLFHLSAGVAAPQSLPEGTRVGVSVDYRVTGPMSASSKYALVVESNAGEVSISVTISPQRGTLQGFLPLAVRPEHQPFNARIDELRPGSAPMPVSNTATLKTSY